MPVIMQQRLLEIGKWLKTNGDAIYGTRAFIRTKKDELINPETNKTIFFTQKDKNIFVICLNWPKGDIVLKGVKASGKINGVLFGTNRPVSVKEAGGNLIITPPSLNPDDHQLAYVFRLSGLIK